MPLLVKSTKERVVKLFIVVVLCFGFAFWCWYDVSYKYIGEEYQTDSKKALTRKSNQVLIPVMIVLGTVAVYFAKKAACLRIEADEQSGISINGQAPIPWDAIEDIDTSNLAKKGYLYIKYRKSPDELATLKLDEYNLDFFAELYTMIRAKLGLPELAGAQSEPLPTDSPDQSQKPSA